jgi:hypothetical protein
MARWDVGRLLETLHTLSYGKRDRGTGARAAYVEIRSGVCAISILLNEAGWPAPRFRGMRRVPPRNISADDKLLSNDRQVIDLHWLWCLRHQPPRKPFKQLLSAPEFDYEFASTIVATPRKAEEKAAALGLSDRQEALLGALQRAATRSRWARIEDAANQLERLLRDKAASGASKLTEAGIKRRINAFYALKIEHGEPSSATVTYRLISGDAMSVPAMKKLKKELAA